MTAIEAKAVELVRQLVPQFDKVKFSAEIRDTSVSLSFYVWTGGERKHWSQLADAGLLDERKKDEMSVAFADFVRKSEYYKSGEAYMVSFTYPACE